MRKNFSFMIIIILLISMCACGTVTEGNNSESSAGAELGNNNDTYGTTFGNGNIIDINVEINEDDWTDMKENAEDEQYHSAAITVNGTTVSNVGIRTKGFSSLQAVANSDSDRFGFKVKLDEYVEGQTLNGLDMFVLNGSFSDPSYMREYLTYAASAYLGSQTPNIEYCNLFINGELFGFYLCIEAYDDSFVERYTDSEDTVLYKAESENCTLLTSDDASGFDIQYGEDEGNTNVKNLISVLNSTTEDNKAQLEKILDVDSVLKAIAVNTVMGNYDSYSGSKAHNYYLLYSDGKFSYIGWDYNMSIGGFSEDQGASVDVDISSPVYGVDISQRPLIEKLLAINEYNERYLGYVESLVDYLGNFEGMVSDLADKIRVNVQNDPSAFYTIDQFEANIIASNADLSELEDRTVGGMGRKDGGMMRPDGQNFNGQMPYGELPEMQQSSDNTNTDFERMQPPGGGTQNDTDAQVPENGDNFDGQKMWGHGGGMSVNTDAVSIIDYITQRITFIKNQESE